MAGNIAPGTPQTPQALKIDVPKVDFSIFGKMADSSIKSAAKNYELYAQTSWAQLSKAAYNNNPNDPIQLGQTLLAGAREILPDDMPEDLRNQFMARFELDGLSLISKAEQNQNKQIDLQNQQFAQANINNLLERIEDDYMGVLQYNIAPGEDKRPIDIEIYNQNAMQLAELANIRDSKGNYVFNESTRRDYTTLSGRKLNGAKRFFDDLLLTNVEDARDYYTKYMLNKEEFVNQSGMDRDTFDKFQRYAAAELKRAGEEVTSAVFNRTRYETARLQTAYIDEKINLWEKQGILPQDVIDVLKSNDVAHSPIEIASQEKFLEALNNASNIIRNADDTDKGNQQRFDAFTDALRGFGGFANTAGLDQDDQTGIILTMARSLVDKNFSEALGPLFSESALNDELFNARENYNDSLDSSGLSLTEAIGRGQTRAEAYSNFVNQTRIANINREDKRSNRLARENAVNVGAQYARAAFRQALAGNVSEANTLLEQGNRAVIRTRASNFVSEFEMDRLEQNLLNNKPAIYQKSDGTLWDFAGYSARSMIFKAKL